MRDNFLYVVLIGFLCGVAIDSLLKFSFIFCLYCFLVSFLLFLTFTFLRKKFPSIFLFSVLVFCIFAGVTRHSFVAHPFTKDIFEDYVGEKIEISGILVDEPDVRESGMRLVVAPDDSKYKILVNVPLGNDFAYGDRVKISGLLELPENFETNTGREFDYISYLKKDGIGYQIYRPDIFIIDRGHGNFLLNYLFRFKKYFIENIQKVIPEPHSSLAGGILLGAKHSLGKELTDAFRQSGLVHVVVLSGYNVTIVAEFIVKVFSFLPKFAGVIGGILGIFAFALITGSGATVVRASIMSCIALVGRATGRNYDILRALFLAASVMVFHNPLILLSDPSFQLSCMATFALVVCSPFFEKKLCFLPEKFGIRSTVASTLATQIFLLPLLIYMTGMVSIVSLVTNLLVLLAVPIAMALSFVTGMVGFFSGFLSLIFGYFSYLLLQYMLLVVEIFSGLPFAYINLPQVSPWLVFILYLIFSFLYVRKKLKQASLPP